MRSNPLDLPEGFELRQEGKRFSIFFEGEDTGKYAFSEAKAVEIINRKSGNRKKKRKQQEP